LRITLEGKGAAMTQLPTRRTALLTSTAMTQLPTRAFNTSIRLPTGELDENRIIGLSRYGREWLQTELEKGLREGSYELASCAVKEADAGNEIADAALRTIAREMLGGALPERKPGYVQVEAYGQRALGQPPHKRPRGRNLHDNLVRDLIICHFIILACHDHGVLPTRNPENRGANRASSGISIVVEALARERNLHLDEASVQRNIWFGLAGALARRHAPTSLWPR
jgi:hypothetical protein